MEDSIQPSATDQTQNPSQLDDLDLQTSPLKNNPVLYPPENIVPPASSPVSETSSQATVDALLSSPAGQNLTEIDITKIQPNPWQPRKVFKEEYLQELANSIKEHGILQPLVVIPVKDGYYQIIVGERRWRASQLAGLTKVPAIIRDAMEEQQKLEIALIENIQRHNLDPIEEGQAYQQLIDQYKMTQEEVARKVGKGRTTVTNMIRLLNLPLKVQRAIADGVISEGHGRAILGLIGMEKQLAIFDEVVVQGMTVRQVEDRVREIMQRPKQIKASRGNTDPELQAIESELRGKLGTKVRVQKNGESGRITIDFFSQEELNGFLEKMHQLD